MNRMLFSALFVGLLAWANVADANGLRRGNCCPSNPCCQPTCCETTCCTTYQTVVRCVPVTRYRMTTCVDACGCCRRVCVPYTAYQRVCCRVPVTTCTTRCCAAPANPCCQPACCDAGPRRAGLLTRLRARTNHATCCN